MIDQEPIILLHQYRLLENSNRYTIVTGGRGSAKSFHVSMFLLNLTYQKGEVILFTRYTLVSAEISIIPEFRQKIDLLNAHNDFDIKSNEIVNKLTGSRILFKGIKTSSGNQTANLKSIQGLTCWVLDEAEEMVNESEFDKIDLSIRTKGKTNRVILVLNPSHVEHWIYKRFFKAGPVDYATYIHTTYKDNLDNLDESFVRTAERAKEKDIDKYKHTYLGEWGTVADSVFKSGYSVVNEMPDDYDFRIFGGDFGFEADPCAVVEVRKDGRNVYLKEIVYEKGLTNKQLAEMLDEKGISAELFIFDSAEPKSIKELRLSGVNAVKAKKGADSLFYGLQLMQNYSFFIHKHSKNIMREFTGYRWAKSADGQYLRNSKGHLIPVDKDNHALDAIRYALTKFDRWA